MLFSSSLAVELMLCCELCSLACALACLCTVYLSFASAQAFKMDRILMESDKYMSMDSRYVVRVL